MEAPGQPSGVELWGPTLALDTPKIAANERRGIMKD